jgi:hypothetical protein
MKNSALVTPVFAILLKKQAIRPLIPEWNTHRLKLTAEKPQQLPTI